MFPDTYKIDYPATPEKLIRIALANFEKKVSGDLQKGNFKETIIMASILEREVRTYEAKQIVAGILWKRIREGWPLQVDVAMETYKSKGLPKEPICNPGLESIKSAVNYKDSDYWFYLSAKTGQTIFSKTFEQHKIAKAKYLH